jgi:hypothetical protein
VLLFAIRVLLLASPNRARSKGATGPPKWESHLWVCLFYAGCYFRLFPLFQVRTDYGIHTTVRQTMGQDIAGACGQLVRACG